MRAGAEAGNAAVAGHLLGLWSRSPVFKAKRQVVAALQALGFDLCWKAVETLNMHSAPVVTTLVSAVNRHLTGCLCMGHACCHAVTQFLTLTQRPGSGCQQHRSQGRQRRSSAAQSSRRCFLAARCSDLPFSTYRFLRSSLQARDWAVGVLQARENAGSYNTPLHCSRRRACPPLYCLHTPAPSST